MATQVFGYYGDTSGNTYNPNVSGSTGTTKLAVSTTGNDTSSNRFATNFTGDLTAYPYLTLQAAINGLAKERRQRGVISLGAGTFTGALFAGFWGNIGVDTADVSVLALAKDAIVIKGTYTPATLATGVNSGTAGAGTTTTVVQKPTLAANWTASDLVNAWFVITGGGGVSTDPDVPAVYKIKANTTTSLTLARTAPGVDSTTQFQIVVCGTTLTSRDTVNDLAALEFAGCMVPIKVVGIKINDSTDAFWAAQARLCSKISFVGCDIYDAIDVGIDVAACDTVDIDGCYVGIGASYGVQAQDCNSVTFRGSMSSDLFWSQECEYNKVQVAFSGCAGGAINIQDSRYTSIDSSVNSCTSVLPVDLRNIAQCQFTSLTGTNAGLAGQVAVNFGGSGQYYVSGASVTTANANNYTLEGASANTWTYLSDTAKTVRRGNTVVTWDFTNERVEGKFEVNGVFNALQDMNIGGKAIYYGYVYYPVLTGQTAYSSGGQANATNTGYNTTVFSTVGENRASVKYPDNLIIAGVEQLVFNAGANIMNLYPPTDGYINDLAQNAPVQVPPGSIAIARAIDGGTLRQFTLSGDFDPSKKYEFYDDFIGRLADWNSQSANSGQADNVVDGEANTPGICTLTTGTNAAGAAGIRMFSSVYMTTGPLRLRLRAKVSAPADGTNSYAARIGMGDGSAVTVDNTDGIYFQHDENSANWIAKTAAGGSYTTTDTGVAVPTNTWQTFLVEVNAAASKVQFYINGSLVATHTTNIPNSSSRFIKPHCKMTKTAGTTSRICYLDYFYLETWLSRPN